MLIVLDWVPERQAWQWRMYREILLGHVLKEIFPQGSRKEGRQDRAEREAGPLCECSWLHS